MPTYEYECLDCGETFEKFQPITAKPLRRCPICGKGKVRRLISAGGGIIFRGNGFYQTDYRSDEYKRKAKADKAPVGSGAKADSSGGNGSSTSKTAGTHASTSKD